MTLALLSLKPVPELTFAQPTRNTLLLPIVIAAAILAAAIALVVSLTPHRTADLSLTHTTTWQAHTIFKADTIVVGQDKAQDDLYVLTTLRIEDKLRLPLFLKDFTATLTTANGETLPSSAAEANDLQPIYATFPSLKALATPPLLRDTQIDPHRSAQGMILLHFPTTQNTWVHRKSATLTIAFYHQDPITVTIP